MFARASDCFEGYGARNWSALYIGSVRLIAKGNAARADDRVNGERRLFSKGIIVDMMVVCVWVSSGVGCNF